MSETQLNVLLVDDDPSLRRLLGQQVRLAGYTVREANDGQEAYEAILADCPDMLVTDWNMPAIDGPDLCRRLRQTQLPHYLYILMLTAKSDSSDLILGIEAGADDFLSKPVRPGELVARLHAGSRMVRLEKSLRQMSERDSLTGVLNLRMFQNLIEREWNRASRHALALSVVLLDIDFFKKINDEHGHAVGDAALVAVANILRQECRPSDYICRYGGEEFLALLTQTDEEGAARWAERIRIKLADHVIKANEKHVRLTVSLGVAQKLADTANPERLIDLADQGLLVAKQSGRNRVVRFSALQDSLHDPFNQGNRHPLDGVLARDVMSTLVLSLHQDDRVQQAAEHVLQIRTGSVPVVDDEGRVVGVISEKDIMALAVEDGGWEHTLREVMETNVVSYEESAPAIEIFDFLCRVSLLRVLVVEQGRPVGVISRESFLRWFGNWTTAHNGPAAEANNQSTQRSGLAKIADALADRSSELVSQLAANHEDHIPYVVGKVTRMQELLSDLLGHCQQARLSV
jgi:two-component system chemotaxis response regulator CheY